MGTLAISFTLHSGDDYAARYESLMRFIRKQGTHWEETTSFVLVETTKSPKQFENDLWLGSDLNGQMDKILVLNVTGNPGVARGKLSYPATLQSIMPNVELVGKQ